MAYIKELQPFIFSKKKFLISFFILLLFFGWSISGVINLKSLYSEVISPGVGVGEIPIAEITIPVDIVFTGYSEEFIDLPKMNSELDTTVFYYGIDYIYYEETDETESLLDLEITLDYNFHFTDESYRTDLDAFIEDNSWDGFTSGLNTTQLNLQEETGERMSIFYEQEGRAIDGEAVEEYLAEHKGFLSDDSSYIIYFLNQSRYDTANHSFEHWFEVDEVDPDSNATTDWWRLEWDNNLNPDVEYPYPCWGFQNRLFFIDPYCFQWYTKWTDIWWNSDENEGETNYLTVDLDTYLENYTIGSVDYIQNLNSYLIDYLNDIVSDVAARGDGLLYNQREISAQILLINDETNHGYSKEDIEWIYHREIAEESFEYVVPNNVANITLEDTWVELSECADLQQIIDDNTLGAAQLGAYSWYKEDWTYLNGINIFYSFMAVANNYFNLSKGDSIFTSWVLLLQNISMVAWSYGEYREYTGLGGGGNVVCFKDLNRYFATDGITPKSGLSSLLIHEIGHVLGFLHAEIRNDAEEGTGGFMREVMSYYAEGTPYFSIFLKDSLYRTSSFVVYYRNKPTIDTYRSNPSKSDTLLLEIDNIITTAETALDEMNYLEAFLAFRELYYYTAEIKESTETQGNSIPIFSIIPMILLMFSIIRIKRRV